MYTFSQTRRAQFFKSLKYKKQMLYIEIELEYMLSFLCIFGVYPIDGVVSASSLSEKGKFTFFTQAAS